jgi:hypothetical protein
LTGGDAFGEAGSLWPYRSSTVSPAASSSSTKVRTTGGFLMFRYIAGGCYPAALPE